MNIRTSAVLKLPSLFFDIVISVAPNACRIESAATAAYSLEMAEASL